MDEKATTHNILQALARHWAVPASVLLCASFLILSLGVYPTYDDWYTLSAPNFDPDWHKYFLPYGSVWRPIDALMGYVSRDATQFPLYNHIITVTGHLLNTLMVYALARRLFTRSAACNSAAIMFCMSPCMLATVFACDAINQTLCMTFGLAATLAFITLRSAWRYVLWALLVWLSALAKDNGIAWAVVPPVLALFAENSGTRTFCRRLAFGVALAIVYAAVRLSLPYTVIPNPEYSTFSLLKKLREVAMLMGYSFVPVDWMSVICAQARQWSWLLLSAWFTIMWLAALLPGCRRTILSRRMAVLAACFVIVLSPNLLITLSMMNAYAGLAFAALMTALLVEKCPADSKALGRGLMCYVLAAAATDIHHIMEARQTAEDGITMALIVNEECAGHRPADKVFGVSVRETERKYSSFHVLPVDAFSNGQAVRWVNNYSWPRYISEEYVEAGEEAKAMKMAEEAVAGGGFDYAFVTVHDKVKVIKARR